MKLCKGCMEQRDDNLPVCPLCGYDENIPPENPMQLMPGVLLADRYIIGKALGYGGFGITYIAYDCVLQIKVAVKEYLPGEFATRYPGKKDVTIFSGNKQEQFNDGLDKFVEEAKRIAKFNSDWGIVHVYNTVRCFNTAYIVMEYLNGETLSSYLEREKKIPPEKAVEMLTPVINSLKVVHQEGIIHRDIAPDNIIVTKDGQIKLIDFGAARYATTTHSRSLTVIIKPGYSPEEQYRSRGDQGAHTDVYSVAATLYRMITGQTPPDALERRAYFENKGKDTLQPVRKYVRDIDDNLETAIMNALNVRIEDRTPNMEVFLNELTSTEPVKRRSGKIKKLDLLRWPLWAKIAFPTVAVGVVVFMVLLSAGLIIKPLPDPEPIVPEGHTRVPSVIGHELSSGEERMDEYKLMMEISDKLNSSEIPENFILTQNIDGGAIVPENTVISVTVSTQLGQVVPNVVGMELEEAKAVMEERGFVVTVKEEYDSVIAEGCIIGQSVEAESEIDEGSEIVLTVSKGKDPNKKEEIKEVTLPNFIGLKYSEAVTKAKELGISVKVTERKYSKGYEKDVVMEQNPDADSKIMTSQTVELVVSLGYNKVEVPDVTYMTEEKARAQLTSRGLRVKVTYKSDEKVAEGRVISQNPNAESEVDPESVVNIVVSTGAPSFKMPDVVGKQQKEATNTLTSKGLSVSINYEQNDSKTEGEVLMQSVSSGSDVKKGDTIILTVCTHSEVITVPNVVGKERSAAEKEIKAKGFEPNIVEVYSDTVARGVVISQNPVAGSGSKSGELVTINVSLGSNGTSSNSTSSRASNNTSSNSNTNTNTNTSTAVTDNSAAITLDKTSAVLTVGDSLKLNIQTNPNKWTMTLSQSWSSSSNTVAAVDGNGNVTAKKEGSAVIKVTAQGKDTSGNTITETASCTVTVKGVVAAEKITLSKSNVTLEISETAQLTATISPNDAVDRTVAWKSSDSSVVSVDDGFIEAKKDGSAVITASTSNGKTAKCTVTVNPIVVKAVQLNKTSLSVMVGKTASLTASVSPSNAKDKSLTWTSSNTSVAVVSDGKVTAYREGRTTVTVKSANNKTASCEVTVTPVVPTAVSLNYTSESMYVGNTLQLTAVVSPDDAKDKSVTWTSSNTSAATVSSGGLVTAKSVGTATITAKTSNGLTAKCSITVTKKNESNSTVEATSVELSSTTLSLDVGEQGQLSATVYPSNAADKSVTWTSSNTSVATVSSNGLVTAKGAGTANVTVKTSNGKTAACKVTVTEIAPSKVTLNTTSLTLDKGSTGQLTATVAPSNAADKSVTWSSDNTSVATVSSSGLVTAKSAGTATVTVKTSNGKTAACRVTVNAIVPTSVSISPTSLTLDEGSTFQLAVTVSPSNADNRTLTWTSSNTSVATVSNGLITAVGEGTATITAATHNGKTASCNVAVNAVGRERTALIGSGDCGDSGDNVQWELYESGNLYIFGSGNMRDSDYVNFNWVNELPWHDDSRIEHIEIESGVTSIGRYAFDGCRNLSSVSIPDSVTEIGDCAFEDCVSLNPIAIPNSVKTIGICAFRNCTSLTEITIPSSVTRIKDMAFFNCTGLSRIYFRGDKPSMSSDSFNGVNADLYYPSGGSGWSGVEDNWNGGGRMSFHSN